MSECIALERVKRIVSGIDMRQCVFTLLSGFVPWEDLRVVSFGGRLWSWEEKWAGGWFGCGRVTSIGGALGRGWELTAPSTPTQTPTQVSSGIPTIFWKWN